ncbi:MAG: AAA family ATPase [Candidatus Altiarchaeota archaeon]
MTEDSYSDFDEGLSLEHEYHNLGNDYYKIGEFDKAIEHYNKALEIRPDLLETYFNRGLAYTRKGFYDKAIEDLTKVIELNPNLAEAYYTRGLVYEYKQDYNQAIVEYNKALEVDPNYSKADSQRKVAESKRTSIASGAAAPGAYGYGAPTPQAMTPGAGGEGGEGLTKFKVMEKPKMNFKDVAGLEKIKEKIFEYIVYPLKDPVLAKKYGKEAGGGVIFYGPPGTGKTFIAKAAAGECQASFISIKMSDIVDMYAGNTEKNLHNAFETARKNKPCILFFDELDGIAGKREGMDQSFEKRSINQFLMEMDGVEYTNEGILVVGATNAPWDVDAALRRAGRFSKTIYFPEPDKKTRLTIAKLNLKNRPVDPKINIGRIARMTEGYSSADLKQLVDAAASIPWKEALKSGKERVITFNDFKKASSGEDSVKSSLPAWYGSVKKKLIEDEETEEDKKKGKSGVLGVIIDSVTMGPPPSAEAGGQTTTVKHKSEQKGLLGEEERRIFDPLIRDIRKRTETGNKGLRKAKTLFARYII